MKSESEKFCKNSFDKYLRKINPALSLDWTDVEKKDEPPDFYLSTNGVIYAVEATKLIQKVDVRAKKHLPVGVIRDLLERFVDDEVETVARKSGSLQGAYLVAFSKPITNFANVKSMIQSELLSYIAATQLATKAPVRVVYKENREECRIEKIHGEESKVVMGGPSMAEWKIEALVEAKQLLDERLGEKQRRLRNIGEPKILLLHNRYHFVDLENYEAVIAEVSSLPSFHTVFIVESNTEGRILYSQEPTWVKGVGPAGAFKQRITLLNNSLYNRWLYHQNGPLDSKCGKKRSFSEQEFFEERR